MHKNLNGACRRLRNPTRRQVLVATFGTALALDARASPLQVGFVHVSPVGQAGWTFQHDAGRRAMERALGGRITTRTVEGVPEGADAERVLRDLARQGCGLIFATSFGYLDPALRVAAEFPQLKIEHAGGWRTAPNLNTYNARFYEGRYLAGYLAGRTSASGVAGYVAGFPVPEVIQGINAFALGMRAANPRASVRVLWLNTWFDPPREREAALALIDAGADVLANHSGSPAVPQAAQARGVRAFGYQSDMAAFAPNAQLAAVEADWGSYYTRVAQAVLAGTWQPRPVWGGMRDGMVRFTALHPSLPMALRDDVETLQRALVAGQIEPFTAPLADNLGRIRLSSGALDDSAIAAMDWLGEGVVGTLPGT
jgi:basic membrane protein A